MKTISRCTLLALLALAMPVGLEAQAKTRVISANPFGLLVDIFNAEFEKKVSESATAGVGGSFLTSDGDDYLNADVFYRFYPSGVPFQGVSFGAKGGITSTNTQTLFGLGFDLNWSKIMGPNRNFYVGVGFGLKRLYGGDSGTLEYFPTFRIINVGFAF